MRDKQDAITRLEVGFVKMPASANEAQAMVNLGIAWLVEHAPERLKQPHAVPAVAEIDWHLNLAFQAGMKHAEKLALEAATKPEKPQPQAAATEQVARIDGMDEYGPILGWHRHWAELPIGTNLFIARQQAQPDTYPALTRDEVQALSAMQSGAPWTSPVLEALAECIAIYEQLRSEGTRPADPADAGGAPA